MRKKLKGSLYKSPDETQMMINILLKTCHWVTLDYVLTQCIPFIYYPITGNIFSYFYSKILFVNFIESPLKLDIFLLNYVIPNIIISFEDLKYLNQYMYMYTCKAVSLLVSRLLHPV